MINKEQKKWSVSNSSNGKWIQVEDSWLDFIPREGIEGLELRTPPAGDELGVTYVDGGTVWYQNIHGTWGFPTVYK